MEKTILSFLFTIICAHCFATTYYLSNSGSDSNAGTSPAEAWQTIDHLNSIQMLPGDSVLFETGNFFTGQIAISIGGTAASPIYFGEYGIGDLPVISGAITVTAWVSVGNNIFFASLNFLPAQVFAENNQLTLARFPNSGFLFSTGGIGVTGLVDSNLSQPSGFWNGANIRMRTNNYQWEQKIVSGYSNDSVFFQTSTINEIQADHGFYFDGLLSQLDTAGEWFYDTTSHSLYANAPGNANPNTLKMEASIFDYGIEILNGSSYITIQNLQFEKQGQDGVYIDGSSNNVIIRNCKFLKQGQVGVRIPDASNFCTVSKCDFTDVNGMGIHMTQGHSALISNNNFERIGIIPGYGSSLTENMTAIECFDCDSSTIALNTIDSVGMCGIFSSASNTNISKNSLKNCLLNANNFGALNIYNDGSFPEHSCSIDSNTVLYTHGNVVTTPAYPIIVSAIFFDYGCSDNECISNNIAFATNGIELSRSTNKNSLYHNLVYGCTESQLKISEGDIQGTTINNQVLSNIFFSLNEASDVVKLSSSFSSFQPATFDSNYYFNPYAYNVVKEELGPQGDNYPNYYTLEQWQTRRGMDLHSHSTFFHRDRYKVTDTTSDNLIGNSFFTNNFDGWVNFHPDTLSVLLDNSTPLDNGCLKVNFLFSLPDSVYGPSFTGFHLDSAALYQLHISNYSLKEGNIVAKCKEFSNAGGSYVMVPRAFPFKDSRQDYDAIIQTSEKCEDCFLTMDLKGIDSLVWLDNIILFAVNGSYEEPEKKSRLFFNPTDSTTTFDLGDSIFYDLDQHQVEGAFALPPYSSAVLIFDSSLILSVDEPTPAQLLKIFPNPVTRGTTIKVYSPQASNDNDISILDIEGEQLFSQIISGPMQIFTAKIPSSLSEGTYFITIKNKEGFWSGKIVVQ